MEMVSGKLKNGYEYNIPKERFGKWKMLKLLKGLKSDPTLVVEVVDNLMGDQAEAFIDSMGEDPTVDEVTIAITEIFNNARNDGDEEIKKSSPLPA